MDTTTSTPSPIPSRLFPTTDSSSFEAFKILIANPPPTHYPLATKTTSNIPIYTLPPFSSLSPSQRSALQDEWHHILLSGPGIFITKNLYPDTSLLTHVNEVFASIIASEAVSHVSKGDHFAPPNANTRIWNAFSKHGLRDPSSFLAYYSNPWIPLIASAWLGPAHRLTAQVNIVMPGGEAQIPHRDYHLGFQGTGAAAEFPRAAHAASQFLTLQGAVAHGDMPVESGPTRVLPYSQLVEGGYLAIRSEEFRALFEEKYVSLGMQQGDGMFFNPALFHAAGSNLSTSPRVANLWQISSAFGKPMESVDTGVLIGETWRVLREKYEREGESEEVSAFVGCVAEGYPFPTNLDRRVPGKEGMAPENEQDVVLKGLREGWKREQVVGEVGRLREESRA